MYQYKSKILRVIDGDTVDVDIDLGFGIWLRKERVRIMRIDTPESRTRDKEEKRFGLAAKNRLKELLPVGSIATLMTQIDKDGDDAKGKFGRILGDFLPGFGPITPCSTMVTDVLIKEGHAVAYYGQNKEDIEKAHLLNREKLIKEGKV